MLMRRPPLCTWLYRVFWNLLNLVFVGKTESWKDCRAKIFEIPNRFPLISILSRNREWQTVLGTSFRKIGSETFCNLCRCQGFRISLCARFFRFCGKRSKFWWTCVFDCYLMFVVECEAWKYDWMWCNIAWDNVVSADEVSCAFVCFQGLSVGCTQRAIEN